MDPVNRGFQCYHEKENADGFFLPFSSLNGSTLLCTSPGEVEDFLKACKQKRVLDISMCSYKPAIGLFICAFPDGSISNHEPKELDNFYCMYEKDFKRVKERCSRGK